MPPVQTPRRVISAYRFIAVQESAGKTVYIDANSTALLVEKGLSLSGKSTGVLTHNSTGVLKNNQGVEVSGQATYGLLTANSTALILPNSVRVGAKTSYISSNSTGIKIGAKYISCNSTGNNFA